MKRLKTVVAVMVLLLSAAAQIPGAAVAYAADPVCQFATELVVLGLLPAADAESPSVAAVLCEGGVGSLSALNDFNVTQAPPPVPAPGTGDLHLVTEQLTKDVTQTGSGEVIDLGSMTITVTQDTMGYSLDAAFALSSSNGISVADCGQALARGQPWQVQYPSALGGGVFNYPGSAGFLQQLAEAGYIDTSRVDVSSAPQASWPTNLWARQPTFGDVLGSAAPEGLAGTLAPGVLYVNLDLTANQGESRWQVQEWNYAFAVHAQLAQVCPSQPRPQPQRKVCPQGTADAGQPVPADGDCNPSVRCPGGLQPRPDGSCGSGTGTLGEMHCLAGTARAGEVPPADANLTQWCSTPAPPVPSSIPCGSPGECPAVLTCGGGIPCPLLPPPQDYPNDASLPGGSGS